MLGETQRETLFHFFDCISVLCADEQDPLQLPHLGKNLNIALARLERDFPASMQVIYFLFNLNQYYPCMPAYERLPSYLECYWCLIIQFIIYAGYYKSYSPPHCVWYPELWASTLHLDVPLRALQLMAVPKGNESQASRSNHSEDLSGIMSWLVLVFFIKFNMLIVFLIIFNTDL